MRDRVRSLACRWHFRSISRFLSLRADTSLLVELEKSWLGEDASVLVG